jgi:hypothetical protein
MSTDGPQSIFSADTDAACIEALNGFSFEKKELQDGSESIGGSFAENNTLAALTSLSENSASIISFMENNGTRDHANQLANAAGVELFNNTTEMASASDEYSHINSLSSTSTGPKRVRNQSDLSRSFKSSDGGISDGLWIPESNADESIFFKRPDRSQSVDTRPKSSARAANPPKLSAAAAQQRPTAAAAAAAATQQRPAAAQRRPAAAAAAAQRRPATVQHQIQQRPAAAVAAAVAAQQHAAAAQQHAAKAQQQILQRPAAAQQRSASALQRPTVAPTPSVTTPKTQHYKNILTTPPSLIRLQPPLVQSPLVQSHQKECPCCKQLTWHQTEILSIHCRPRANFKHTYMMSTCMECKAESSMCPNYKSGECTHAESKIDSDHTPEQLWE